MRSVEDTFVDITPKPTTGFVVFLRFPYMGYIDFVANYLY